MGRARLVALCCIAALGACVDPPFLGPSGDPGGAYGYVARFGLTPVVSGTLTLLVDQDSVITGSWELQRVPGSDPDIQVGPQTGTGTLAGRVSGGGVLFVDLNPGWADNNVFLSLQIESSTALTGSWSHSTLLGPVTGGSVTLRRLSR